MEAQFHAKHHREVREDILRVQERLEKQLQEVQSGGASWTTDFDEAKATDSAANAMQSLADTIPPYPAWMERPDDPWRHQPANLDSKFALEDTHTPDKK